MHCFNHPDNVAVGLCKCCSRGLCADCAADLGHGLACRDRHEQQVEAMNMIIEQSARIYSSAPKNILIGPIFFLFMGLLFAGFGLFSPNGISAFPLLLGVGFMLFAGVAFVRSRALFRGQS